jgi:hypothetical protein
MNQPKLFDQMTDSVALEDVLLYALGDFQSRGKVLANRELALDRLQGAFLRAFERFGIAELSDEQVVKGLQNLGADVVEFPNFVAKRPYRVTINKEIAKRAFDLFIIRLGTG